MAKATTKKLSEIDAKIEELKREKAALLEQGLDEARRQCEEIADGVGHTVASLFGIRKRRTSGARPKLPPKYRDPSSGKTWSGRGRAPRWIDDHEQRGGHREELAV